MWRRLYVAFPHAGQARQVVAELEQAGVARSQIHTIAGPGVEIAGLPVANRAQREDKVWLWERVFWDGNLWLFVAAPCLQKCWPCMPAPPAGCVVLPRWLPEPCFWGNALRSNYRTLTSAKCVCLCVGWTIVSAGI